MDYVKIARELVYQMEQDLGTGRTYAFQYGISSSAFDQRNLGKPLVVGVTRQHAVCELPDNKDCAIVIGFSDIEKGFALKGTKGPTLLTHTAQEDLLKALLSRITELEEDVLYHSEMENAHLAEVSWLKNETQVKQQKIMDLEFEIKNLKDHIWELEND